MGISTYHGYFRTGHHLPHLPGWELGGTEMVVKIHNVRVYTEDRTFVPGQVLLEGGRIKKVILSEEGSASGRANGETNDAVSDIEAGRGREEADPDAVIDGDGDWLIPGLIDIHFHGCMGEDFSDGNREAIDTIARYEARRGITAMAPATMTLPAEELEGILETAADYRDWMEQEASVKERAMRSDLVGINMEGPFISVEKQGAQAEEHIIAPDVETAKRFLQASRGLVKYMGIAPEDWEKADHFIREMRDRVHVTLAHTAADYDTAMKAFSEGVNHVVHFYNAMTPFLNREPGLPGAVFDSPGVNAELIADGYHIHPAVVRTTFRLLGEERIILISDTMRAAGLGPGTFTLGGQDVVVREDDGVARLVSTGGIAASVTDLMDCVRRLVLNMGIPLETAVGCATINPAKSLGIYDWCGSVSEGKKASLVILDKDLGLKAVIKDGFRIL